MLADRLIIAATYRALGRVIGGNRRTPRLDLPEPMRVTFRRPDQFNLNIRNTGRRPIRTDDVVDARMRINRPLIIRDGDLRSRNRRQGRFLSGRQRLWVTFNIVMRGRARKLIVDVRQRSRQRQRRVRRPAKIKRTCLLYTSPSPRDQRGSRMPSSA